MAKMTLEEALSLGLLGPEELSRIGFNPFTPRAGGTWTPSFGVRPGIASSNWFRYPSLYSRPGITPLRFGLGGLGQGLTLSPESPGLGIGGIAAPVGRPSAQSVGRGVAGGIAGGIAGGVAGIGAEGSENLPPQVMVLPDGRRLVRYPDGREMILPPPGSSQAPIAAESPEGQQILGMVGRGVGIAQQLARIVGGGGEPTPVAPPSGEGLTVGPEELAALGELGINTDLPAGQTQPVIGPNGIPITGFGETALTLGGTKPTLAPGAFGASSVTDPSLFRDLPMGGPGTTIVPGGTRGMPPLFEGLLEGESGKPPLPLDEPPEAGRPIPEGMEDINFYAPGGVSAYDILRASNPNLFDVRPEDIMATMPEPAVGPGRGRDLDPRGMGVTPSGADIFREKPATGSSSLNVTPANSLNLVQSLLGASQGALANDPAGIIRGLLQSGMSVADIAKIPGLGSSVGGLLGLLNVYQGIESGNIPGAAQGGVAAVQSAVSLLQKYPELARSIGVTPEILNQTSGALKTFTGAGGGGMASGLGTISPQMIVGALNAAGVTPQDKDWADMWSPTGGLSMLLSGVNPLGMLIAAAVDTANEFEQTAKLKSGALNNPIKAKLYSGATEGVANANQILQSLNAGGGPERASTESLMAALAPLANSVLPYFQTGQGGVKALRASDAAGSPGTQGKAEYTQNFTNAKAGIESIVNELLARGVSYQDIGNIQGVNPMWASLSLDAGGRPEEFYLRGKGDYAKSVPAFADLLKSSMIRMRGQNVDPGAPNYEAPASWDEAPRYQPEYFIAPPAGMLQPGEQGYEANVGAQSFTPWAYSGAQNIAGMGSPLYMGGFTPDNAFIAALGAAGYDPNAMTPEEQLKGKAGRPDTTALAGVASMYGGPLWMALARMGTSFAPLIQQNFNPWAAWSQMTPDERIRAMGPTVFGPAQMAKDAGVFTSSGVVENPRIADFFAGVTPPPLGPWTPPALKTTPAVAAPDGGATAFDPLAFLSSLQQGQRIAVQAGGETLSFVPYKPEQSAMFTAPDGGYQQIGEGFYVKPSGQAGLEVYVPQDRPQDLGRALSGASNATAAQLAAALAQQPPATGQEAGATPGAGPAADIAPEAVAAGTQSTTPQGTGGATTADTPQPLPGSGGFKEGGVVPETGKYTLHEGEAVIPAEKTDEPGEAQEFVEGMRGQGKLPALAQDETAKPEKGWYVHLKEGIPTQDLDGTDPMVRRLAFTPDDVEQALEDGEAPIMVGKGVLALPPSAIRGLLQRAQDTQFMDPMKHPAIVAMGNRIKKSQSIQPEGDMLPGGANQKPAARFPGDRGRSADQPLESLPKKPDMGGRDDDYSIRRMQPPARPPMPMIPGPKPGGPMQTLGTQPGFARAMRLASANR